jgi:N utilization substance protein B
MLFQWEMNPQSARAIERKFWRVAKADAPTQLFANQLFEGTVETTEQCDELITKFSRDWRIERMAPIDKAILRLAIWEFRSGSAPVKVVMNEALTLAHKFSSEDSISFLNGILESISKSLEPAS